MGAVKDERSGVWQGGTARSVAAMERVSGHIDTAATRDSRISAQKTINGGVGSGRDANSATKEMLEDMRQHSWVENGWKVDSRRVEYFEKLPNGEVVPKSMTPAAKAESFKEAQRELEQQKAVEKQRAEHERQRAEHERQRADQERQRAEHERQQVEQVRAASERAARERPMLERARPEKADFERAERYERFERLGIGRTG
jgi:cell division protein FtsN